MDREDKIDNDALERLLKRSTVNTTIAWGLVWFSVFMFISIKYSSFDSVFGVKISSIDTLYLLILALLFKIESFHLFIVWKYDKNRLARVRSHFKNQKN